jgi:hypothetical protein
MTTRPLAPLWYLYRMVITAAQESDMDCTTFRNIAGHLSRSGWRTECIDCHRKMADHKGIRPGDATAPLASDAWVAPDGTFYYVTPWGHCWVAEYRLGDDTAGAVLERRGWVHLSYGMPQVDDEPTSAQMRVLRAVLSLMQAERHTAERELARWLREYDEARERRASYGTPASTGWSLDDD